MERAEKAVTYNIYNYIYKKILNIPIGYSSHQVKTGSGTNRILIAADA